MTLPITHALDAVRAALADVGRVVVAAPTGSGKTTGLPPALMDEPWLGGRLLLLEPRRVAARAAARYMASDLGERVGGTVGFTTRDERKVSGRTRLEVVTEGILTRRLQRDPALEGVDGIIFDEFHERSVDADLGLALALDVAELRSLRIVVMSATLDTERVAALVEGPVVTSEARSHPVEIEYQPSDRSSRVEQAVAAAVLRALPASTGDILCFLPGAGEIRRTADALGRAEGLSIVALHGSLPPAEQDRALGPDPAGRRKVILATDVAETSLTIDGVTTVVDSGLRRSSSFSPATGMDRLDTVRISKASAAQRAGRAGRTAPGRCIRLWAEHEHRRLADETPPAITTSDPAPLLLAAAGWGTSLDGLRLLDVPPTRATESAMALLEDLGAIDRRGITARGTRLLGLPTHPRLAAMLDAAGPGEATTAAAIASLVGDRDILIGDGRAPTADLGSRLDVLSGAAPPQGTRLARGPLARVRSEARRLGRAINAKGDLDPDAAGHLLAVAYPERVAKKRGEGTYTSVSGRGLRLLDDDVLTGDELLAVGPVDDRGDDGRILLAAPLNEDTLLELREPTAEHVVEWDPDRRDVRSATIQRIGSLVLAERPSSPTPGLAAGALLDGIRRHGLDLLHWSAKATSLRERAGLLHDHLGDPWPDLSDTALLADVETWLGPYLGKARRAADLRSVDVTTALSQRIGWDRVRSLEALAPSHYEVPSGSKVRIRYDDPGRLPVLSVKLQEMFGASRGPTIADGRIPVVVHLLSPAGRPLQITSDLDAFWDGSYAEVRKEMRGRYPKHPWPEDPRSATPTKRTKRGQSRD